MHKNSNFGILDNYNANKTKAKNPRGYATRFIFGLTSGFHTENWVQFYTRWQQFSFKNHKVTLGYKALL